MKNYNSNWTFIVKIAIVLTTSITLSAKQSLSQKPVFEYGKITAKDLDVEKYKQKYPGAHAVVIGDVGECKFNMETVDQVHAKFQYIFTQTTRIIILDEKDLDYGNISIPYYEGENSKMTITNFRANVHNLKSGKVSSTRVRQRDGSVMEYESQMRTLNYSLPDVSNGSVIEYRYTIVSDFYRRLPEWRFQSLIPVEHSEYNLDLPAFFNYRLRYRGFEELTVNSQRAYTESMSYKKTSQVYGKTVDAGIIKVNVPGTRYRWVAKNMPALIAEPLIDNIQNYASAISFELLSMDITQYDHNTVVTHYANTWNEVASALNGHNDFGGFLMQAPIAISELLNITPTGDTEKDVKTAYYELQKKIKWNKNNSVTARRTPAEVISRGNGNSAEINLLLCALLRNMGITADPVVLSTVDNIKLSENPTFSELNYVIVAVPDKNGKNMFLDATEQYLPAGYLPIRALNGKAVILTSSRANFINISNPEPRKTVKNYFLKINEAGEFEGHFENQYLQYNSYLALKDYHLKGREFFSTNFSSIEGLDLKDYEIITPDVPGDVFITKGKFSLKNATTFKDNEISFLPLLIESIKEHPFKSETRRYPIEYFVTETEEITVTIEFPETFRIKNIPEPHTILWGRTFSYDYKISEEGNKITISTRRDIMETPVQADRYNGIVDFHNRIVRKNLESIILQRK
ncbi:MAG: DUF3857 domain-containing protein [Bacteroidetes bacterium]|nr:DUF3857 domain-containing protein [Bacteroidota bacterium]